MLAEELRKRSIAVRYFDGYLRITAGSQEENNRLIQELSAVLKEVSQ